MVVSTLKGGLLLVLIGALVVTVSHGFSCANYANGCSMPNGWAYKQLFTPACTTHDVCYRCGARYAIARSRCDDVFKSDMLRLCVGQRDSRDCINKANTYFTLVRGVGWTRYHLISPRDCSADSRVRSICLRQF